jgi:hypothetical protein
VVLVSDRIVGVLYCKGVKTGGDQGKEGKEGTQVRVASVNFGS